MITLTFIRMQIPSTCERYPRLLNTSACHIIVFELICSHPDRQLPWSAATLVFTFPAAVIDTLPSSAISQQILPSWQLPSRVRLITPAAPYKYTIDLQFPSRPYMPFGFSPAPTNIATTLAKWQPSYWPWMTSQHLTFKYALWLVCFFSNEHSRKLNPVLPCTDTAIWLVFLPTLAPLVTCCLQIWFLSMSPPS